MWPRKKVVDNILRGVLAVAKGGFCGRENGPFSRKNSTPGVQVSRVDGGQNVNTVRHGTVWFGPTQWRRLSAQGVLGVWPMGQHVVSETCGSTSQGGARAGMSGPNGGSNPRARSARLACVLGVVLCASHAGAADTTTFDLRGGGAFDTVSIAGFLIPIDDIDALNRAQVLALNPATGRFAFADRVSSERQLMRALRGLELRDGRAVRDLYRAAKVALPNAVAHTLTVPSGFGPGTLSNQRAGVVLGVGIGGVSRVPYTNKADGGIAFGLSFGNAFDTLGVSIGLTINDLSNITDTDRMSFGIEFSRYIADGLSVAVGGENLFVTKTDGEDSYYAVGSWAFDADRSVLPFDGVATLGVGSGRFANLTARDTAEGRGKHATAVFGSLAWEVTERFNVVADWNGRNLSAGVAFRLPKSGISAKLGLRDLTGHSGDGARLTGSIGFAIAQF